MWTCETAKKTCEICCKKTTEWICAMMVKLGQNRVYQYGKLYRNTWKCAKQGNLCGTG